MEVLLRLYKEKNQKLRLLTKMKNKNKRQNLNTIMSAQRSASRGLHFNVKAKIYNCDSIKLVIITSIVIIGHDYKYTDGLLKVPRLVKYMESVSANAFTSKLFWESSSHRHLTLIHPHVTSIRLFANHKLTNLKLSIGDSGS